MNYTKEQLEVLLFSFVFEFLSPYAERLGKGEDDLIESTYRAIEKASQNENLGRMEALMKRRNNNV